MTTSQKNIQILIATHKPYTMPQSDIYLPIQVGKKQAGADMTSFIGDDTGESISNKNPIFCELTALYWAWKNLDCEYIGLAHYRRHFKNPRGNQTLKDAIKISKENRLQDNPKARAKLQKVLSKPAIEKILQTTDVILPKKRKYYIENLYDHYCKTMNPEPLNAVREIISNQCPEYLIEFDLLKHRRSAHMFNMFIMKRNILNDYCDWLFPILFELEEKIDTTGWSAFQRRYAGRISELLLDVWLNTHQMAYTELSVTNIEPVNWLKKGSGFLLAKFFGRKYEKSW